VSQSANSTVCASASVGRSWNITSATGTLPTAIAVASGAVAASPDASRSGSGGDDASAVPASAASNAAKASGSPSSLRLSSASNGPAASVSTCVDATARGLTKNEPRALMGTTKLWVLARDRADCDRDDLKGGALAGIRSSSAKPPASSSSTANPGSRIGPAPSPSNCLAATWIVSRRLLRRTMIATHTATTPTMTARAGKAVPREMARTESSPEAPPSVLPSGGVVGAGLSWLAKPVSSSSASAAFVDIAASR
jgi:hypothetical protein